MTEVRVTGTEEITGENFLQFQCGDVRKLISIGETRCLRFPDATQLVEVQVFAPVARCRVHLKPGWTDYQVDFSGMKVDLSVTKTQDAVKATPSSSKRLCEGLGTRTYLEDHWEEIQMMQTMLQRVVTEKPEDPLAFMANFFAKSADPHLVDFSSFKKAQDDLEEMCKETVSLKNDLAEMSKTLQEKDKEIQVLHSEMLAWKMDDSRPCTTSTAASSSDGLGACSPEPRAPPGSPNQSFQRKGKMAVKEASDDRSKALAQETMMNALKRNLIEGMQSGQLDAALGKHVGNEAKAVVREKLREGLMSGKVDQVLSPVPVTPPPTWRGLTVDAVGANAEAQLLRDVDDSGGFETPPPLKQASNIGQLENVCRQSVADVKLKAQEVLQEGFRSGSLNKALPDTAAKQANEPFHSPPQPTAGGGYSTPLKKGSKQRLSLVAAPSAPVKPPEPAGPNYEKAGSAETVEDMRSMVKGNLFTALETGMLQKALGTPEVEVKPKSRLFEGAGLQKEWKMPPACRSLPPQRNVETACEMLEQIVEVLPKLSNTMEQVLHAMSTQEAFQDRLAELLPGLVQETMDQLRRTVSELATVSVPVS